MLQTDQDELSIVLQTIYVAPEAVFVKSMSGDSFL